MPDTTSYRQLPPEGRLAIAKPTAGVIEYPVHGPDTGRLPATASRELMRNSPPWRGTSRVSRE